MEEDLLTGILTQCKEHFDSDGLLGLFRIIVLSKAAGDKKRDAISTIAFGRIMLPIAVA